MPFPHPKAVDKICPARTAVTYLPRQRKKNNEPRAHNLKIAVFQIITEKIPNLKQQISKDLKAAMRAADAKWRDRIRLLQAAIKQREVDERIQLDDAAVPPRLPN